MRALRGDSVDQTEMLVTLPGDKKAWLVATARPLLSSGQDIQGSVTVFHDISERKQFEGELGQGARRGVGIGALALGVSGQHEP